MGLKEVNNALGKIVGFSEKITDGEIGNVKIPKVVLGKTIGLESENVTTVSGLVDSIKGSASNLLQITRQVQCLIMLFTDKGGMAKDLLGGMAMTAVNVASALALQVAQAFATQIQIAINKVLGVVSDTYNGILSLFKSIVNLWNAITSIPDKFSELADVDIDWWLSKEQCEAMFAEIAACYIAKFLKKLKVFETVNKITDNINKVGTGLNKRLSDSLYDVDVMNNYIERESFLMEKSARQINSFSFV